MTPTRTAEARRPNRAPVRLQGIQSRSLETARDRLVAAGMVFALAFVVMAGRAVQLTMFDQDGETTRVAASPARFVSRADIVDRNGIVLATSLPTASLYADPQKIRDPAAAAAALRMVFPDLEQPWLLGRLGSSRRFTYIRRNLTPPQAEAVNRLGIPGLGFEWTSCRVYPHGRAAAHVLGLTNVDGVGIAGVEQSFDQALANGERVTLSLDIPVQHIVREELKAAQSEFRAIGAAGIVLDVQTGELLSMVSLPDFDPNSRTVIEDEDARFNRITKGVYEMGSVFKLFTIAMALDTGTTSLRGGYDASRPIRVGGYTISDYHPESRWLSVPEILVHSSNIGAAEMALDVGGTLQQQYLQRLGLFGTPAIELPERGEVLPPRQWRDINTMTIGFGHGIAVTPLQLSAAVATVVNGGILRPTTLLKREPGAALDDKQVLSARTSKQMRSLMRMVVTHGTATRAEVPGYLVGGKTGTAEKLVNGFYNRDKRISSFVGAFPMDQPRYVVWAMVDEPKGNKSTFGYATGGWVAAPVVGRIVSRIAPLLGITPVETAETTGTKQLTPAAKGKSLMVAIQEAIASTKDSRLASN
jgi:cell division protein FtsI (penicillin-binding protein 3)